MNITITEIFLNLTPLEEEFLTRRGTEIQSALELFKATTDKTDTVPTEALPLAIANLTREIKQLFALAKEKGLVTIGGSAWNAYQLIQLAREIKKHNYLENYQIVQLAHGDVPTRQEIIQDIQQRLIQSSLKGTIYFLKIMKGTTLLLEPQAKAFSQSVLDGSTHVLNLVLHIPQKVESRRNPHAITWKDTAHKVFKVTVSTLSLVGSMYAAALSMGYTDKEDSGYKTANQLAMAGMIADIGYGLLQQTGLLQKRD